jgi:hypothetical protein
MEIVFIPEWLFGGIGENKRKHLNYCISALLVILSLPYVHLLPHVCLVRWLIGIRCPGCGITTALTAIFKLDFDGALKANCAAPVIALLLIFQVLVRPIALCSPSVRINTAIDKFSRSISFCASASLLLAWVAKLVHS